MQCLPETNNKKYFIYIYKPKNRDRRPSECFGDTVRINDLGINYLIHFTLNI